MSCKDGWKSWMIASACSLLVLIFFGVARISGILFVEIMKVYGVERDGASVPFILTMMAFSIMGPISGYMAQILEIRNVVALGCIICSLGAILASISSTMLQINIFWGVMQGLGAGLATHPLPQVINLCFKKHKTKAIGLTFAGAPVSSFIFAPIANFLLNQYGLSGTFLILSGIILNGVPLACLLKTPKSITSDKRSSTYKVEISSTQEVITIPSEISVASESQNTDAVEKDNCHTPTYNVTSRNVRDLKHEEHATEIEIDSQVKIRNIPIDKIKSQRKESIELPNRPIYKKSKKFLRVKIYNYFNVFCDPSFLIISIAWSFMCTFNPVILTVFADFYMDKGLLMIDVVHLMLWFSVSDAVTRLSIGYIADKNFLSKAYFVAICFFTQTLILAFVVLATSYEISVLAITLDGISVGAIVATAPTLIFEYIPKEKHMLASPASCIATLPMSLVTPFLIGYFRDTMKSYNGLLFIFCGIHTIIGVTLICLPHLNNRKKKDNDSNTENLDLN